MPFQFSRSAPSTTRPTILDLGRTTGHDPVPSSLTTRGSAYLSYDRHCAGAGTSSDYSPVCVMIAQGVDLLKEFLTERNSSYYFGGKKIL